MDEPRQPTQLESIQSVARRLGIGRSTIYAWVSQGRFPYPRKLGRSSRWPVSEVDEWVSARTGAPQKRAQLAPEAPMGSFSSHDESGHALGESPQATHSTNERGVQETRGDSVPMQS